NQLDADGTGTNNTVSTVFGTSLPGASQVYNFIGGAYNLSTYAIAKGGGSTNWTDPNLKVNPGQGVWVKLPTGSPAQSVTTVGQVLQGSLSNPNISSSGGFNLISDQVPLAGALQTALGYQ